MQGYIVIGANFGDEGKGLVTDFLSTATARPIVVRFNGGAQAGHTVVKQTGMDTFRHVFHHFGSGTLSGVSTFLSKYFITNPIAFNLEYETLSHTLAQFGRKADVTVDFKSPMTTPYDMIINEVIEEARGNKRHGSCGYGIGETVERTITDERFVVRAEDMLHLRDLRDKLITIRDEYVEYRLKDLSSKTGLALKVNLKYMTDTTIDFYIDHCALMMSSVQLNDIDYLKRYNTLIFEGAQGLLLDEFHKFFPHVTRSRTGIFNAVEIAKELGLPEVDVFYVTRSYLTRHGAGPLPFEAPNKIYDKIEDTTNLPNKWQGDLRFAPLNVSLLKESIKNDMATVNDIKVIPNLVITCLDQLPHDTDVRYVQSGIVLENRVNAFIKTLKKIHPFSKVFGSYGPSRSDIVTL
ncbi:MAG: adenylosuccinate synthase [Candidatus Thorarchaeota archaeon]|nr:MAG: adenylosuccinate synthase [Candidatus Thorarchaeota archaeon]